MGRKPRLFKKQSILEAVKGSNGNMSVIASRLGCDWHVAKNNVERFPETTVAFNDETEKMGDFVESKGYELVKKGDGQMIRYYLSTKFKNRGYRLNDPDDSNQLPGVNSAPIKIVIEGNTLPTVRDEIENGN